MSLQHCLLAILKITLYLSHDKGGTFHAYSHSLPLFHRVLTHLCGSYERFSVSRSDEVVRDAHQFLRLCFGFFGLG